MHRSEPVAASDDFAANRRGSHDVLVDAVDLYVRAPGHDKAEIRAFAALVDGLLDRASAAARRRVSIALAERPDTPPDVARRLATDSIEVAEPMILGSPVLTSTDLVEIMRRGPEHVRCVTHRLDLAPDIAAVLVDTTVPGPDRAAIAPAARRRGEAATRAAPTPPPTVAVEPEATVSVPPPPMFAVPVRPTPPTTPAATTTSEPIAERTARRAAPAALRDGHGFLALDSAGRWRALQSASLETATRTAPSRGTIHEAGLLGDRLLTAILADDPSFFADALTGALGLDRALIDAILAEPSGEVLAVVLIACGIGEIRATSLLLHHLGAGAGLGTLQDLAALVERTPRRVAEHLVLSWREERPSRRGAALRQSDPAERRETAGAARETDTGEARSTSDRTAGRHA